MADTIELAGDAGASHPMIVADDPPADELPEPDAPPSEPDEDTAVAETAEDAKQRRVLLRKIHRYRAIFPEEVRDLELDNLQTRAIAELETTLADVQFAVETRRSTAQARSLFLAGLAIGEAGGRFVGLKLQGLTGVAAQSEDLLRNVDEVALKYEAVTQLDPVARLALSVGQLALAVDQANRSAANRQADQPTTTAAASPESSNKPEQAGLPASGKRPNNISSCEFSDL